MTRPRPYPPDNADRAVILLLIAAIAMGVGLLAYDGMKLLWQLIQFVTP